MKIIEAQAAILTNYEVYTHLSTLKKEYAVTPKLNPKTGKPTRSTYQRRGPGNYETVTKEVLEYLTTSPSPLAEPVYNANTIKELFTRLRPYKLEQAEILMIMNLRPLDECALNMVVEELYSRFAAEQHQEMITIISEVLGTPGKNEGDATQT